MTANRGVPLLRV